MFRSFFISLAIHGGLMLALVVMAFVTPTTPPRKTGVTHISLLPGHGDGGGVGGPTITTPPAPTAAPVSSPPPPAATPVPVQKTPAATPMVTQKTPAPTPAKTAIPKPVTTPPPAVTPQPKVIKQPNKTAQK